MKQKSVKSGKLFLMLFVVLALITVGCNRSGSKTDASSEDFEVSDSAIDQETQEQLNTAKRIFYSLPSPLETAMLIKNAGADYDEELLNPVNNSSRYITSKSRALNLGIYSTDLSFASPSWCVD